MTFGTRNYGYYSLLNTPFCQKCAYPGLQTHQCTWHTDNYGYNRIFAVGPYVSSRTQRGYNDLLSKHIRGLKKFKGYATPLGNAIALCVKELYSELASCDVIVPVPLHPTEMKIDGKTGESYSHTFEISTVVEGILNIPVKAALEKSKPLKMKGLSRRDRLVKVRGVYRPLVKLDGAIALLVDDVFTSGATASECASMLLQSGAKLVQVAVAGRDITAEQ